MKWYESRLAGAVGGAFVAGGVMLFTTILTTEELREIVGYTGIAVFGHLAGVFGISRIQRSAP